MYPEALWESNANDNDTVFGEPVFLCVIIGDAKLQGISMLKLERQHERRDTSRHMIKIVK